MPALPVFAVGLLLCLAPVFHPAANAQEYEIESIPGWEALVENPRFERAPVAPMAPENFRWAPAPMPASLLLVGDSWARILWAERDFEIASGIYGATPFLVFGNSTTEGGTTARQWTRSPRKEILHDAVTNTPNLVTVHVQLGINDFVSRWKATFTPEEQAALIVSIATDVATVAANIELARPGVAILVGGYDYLNLNMDPDIRAFFGIPTDLRMNEVMIELETAVAAALTAVPGAQFLSNFGLMQYSFGFEGTPQGPHEICPPGDLGLPSPAVAMAQWIHLSPAGYQLLGFRAFTKFHLPRLIPKWSPRLSKSPGDYSNMDIHRDGCINALDLNEFWRRGIRSQAFYEEFFTFWGACCPLKRGRAFIRRRHIRCKQTGNDRPDYEEASQW